MTKALGILLMLAAIWVGMEIYTKGMDSAFGGILAGATEPLAQNHTTPYDASSSANTSDAPSERLKQSLAQQIGARVKSDLERGAERSSGEIGGENDSMDADSADALSD